jgi:hypothetical protein
MGRDNVFRSSLNALLFRQRRPPLQTPSLLSTHSSPTLPLV